MTDKGRRAEVVLINGFKFEIILTKKLKVEELIILAGNQCQIYEPDLKYFGIAYVDEKDHYIWLRRDKKVIDCELPSKWYRNENILNQDTLLQFHFAVKYFVSNFINLLNPGSVVMFFLESKSLFLKGYLDVPLESYAYMYALILQYYRGDYVSHNMYSVLSLSIYFPKNILKKLNVSAEEFRIQIGFEYQKLIGMRKGEVVVKFLTLAEKSFIYGSRLFQVKDKNNTSYLLSINNRGISQYTNDLQFKLKRVFPWENLNNFHYLDQHFSIEVETNVNNYNITEDTKSDITNVNLEKEINGHDRVLSSLMRNSMTIPIKVKQKYNFFCDSPYICRVLWDSAVSQHQFYLDQLSNSKNQALLMQYNDHNQIIESDFKRIINNINEVLTNNTLTPFANNECGSKMSTHSLMSNLTSSSLNDTDISSDVRIIGIINGSHNIKTEEDKERRLKAYKGLKEKKNKLEELLLQKLDELKDVCINEAELTGELPKEIYRTLAPGEPEPKIKKRIGTAFKLSNDILNKTNKDDKVNKLEMEIDIQRKIVDAASRLASDKTTNKSVRKKRRRDFEAAHQKLKGLELGLRKIHMARSKPDLSYNDYNKTKYNGNGWLNHSGIPRSSESLKSLVTKSCPTTPRGSLSDLSYYQDTRRNYNNEPTRNLTSTTNISEKLDSKFFNSSLKSNYQYNNCLSDITKNFGAITNSPPSLPSKRANSIVSTKPNTFINEYSYDNDKMEEQSKSYHDIHNIPIYANIGYHTSAPYISSYRQSHYPTLFDQQVARSNNRQSRSNSMTPVNNTKKTTSNNSVAAAASTQMGLIVKQISQSSLMSGPYTTSQNPHYNSIYNISSLGDKNVNCNNSGSPITYYSKNESFNRLPMKDSNGILKHSSSLLSNQCKVTTFPASYERIGNYKVAPENSTITTGSDKKFSFMKDDWRKDVYHVNNLTNQQIGSTLSSYHNDINSRNSIQDDKSNKNSTATIV